MAKDEVKPGEWVLMDGDEIIDHNANVKKLMAKYRKLGNDNLVITKNPHGDHLFY